MFINPLVSGCRTRRLATWQRHVRSTAPLRPRAMSRLVQTQAAPAAQARPPPPPPTKSQAASAAAARRLSDRERVYLTWRAVFSEELGMSQLKADAFKKRLFTQADQSPHLTESLGRDRTFDVALGLMRDQVFKSETRARKEFPQLFKGDGVEDAQAEDAEDGQLPEPTAGLDAETAAEEVEHDRIAAAMRTVPSERDQPAPAAPEPPQASKPAEPPQASKPAEPPQASTPAETAKLSPQAQASQLTAGVPKDALTNTLLSRKLARKAERQAAMEEALRIKMRRLEKKTKESSPRKLAESPKEEAVPPKVVVPPKEVEEAVDAVVASEEEVDEELTRQVEEAEDIQDAQADAPPLEELLKEEELQMIERIPNSAHPGFERLYPARISYSAQHVLMNEAQRILEEACYNFARQHLPEMLKARGWDCGEAAELTVWVRYISKGLRDSSKARAYANRQKIFPTTAIHVLPPIDSLRHLAVHRQPISIKTIDNLLRAGLGLVCQLADQQAAGQLVRMRRRLAQAMTEFEEQKEKLQKVAKADVDDISRQRAALEKREQDLVEGMVAKDREFGYNLGEQVKRDIENILRPPPPPPRPLPPPPAPKPEPPKAKSKSEPKPAATKPESKPEAKSEPKSAPKPAPKSEPKSEPKQEPEQPEPAAAEPPKPAGFLTRIKNYWSRG